jgi:hypothetical protein
VEAREVMRDILSGRRKRPNHRVPLTDTERREASPIHSAADTLSLVRTVLHRLYPEQSSKHVGDRAIAIACQIHKVKEETLHNYLKRSKSDRRRL